VNGDTSGREADRMALLALAYLVEPGSNELGTLIREIGARQALLRVLAGSVSDYLAGAVAARLATQRLAPTPSAVDALAELALRHAERLGARIVTPVDPDWPPRVEDLVAISGQGHRNVDRDLDPPICLWVRGEGGVADVAERAVAIVGARASTGYGAHVATELAYGLADRGWTVVSGGAFGIDAAAHRGALARAGRTVAVLACGIDRPYPAAHTSLFEQIADEGLLISEWPPGSAPHRQRFLIRNRVIAALTAGTVMVEAAARSGARQTLGRARALGRPAMAVPGPVLSAMSVGCNAELRAPETRLVTTAAEVVEEVGRIGELAPVPTGEIRPHDALGPLAARLLDAVLPRRIRTAQEVAAAAGVSDREARQGLPLLVDAGFVVAVGDGYRLAPARPT
jgi:DNA processing protein